MLSKTSSCRTFRWEGELEAGFYAKTRILDFVEGPTFLKNVFSFFISVKDTNFCHFGVSDLPCLLIKLA